MAKFSGLDFSLCRLVLSMYGGIDSAAVKSFFALGYPPPIFLSGFDVSEYAIRNLRLFSRVMKSFGVKISYIIHRRLLHDGIIAKDFCAFPLSDLVDDLEIEIFKKALFQIFDIKEK